MAEAIPFPQAPQPNEVEALKLQIIDTQRALHLTRQQLGREMSMSAEMLVAKCDEEKTRLVDGINARVKAEAAAAKASETAAGAQMTASGGGKDSRTIAMAGEAS